MGKSYSNISAYKQIDLQTRVDSATPHTLISMLYEALVQQLRIALSAITSNDKVAMNKALEKASELIGGLREALDMRLDSALPHRLDALYDYMQRKVISARLSDPEPKIMEVMELVITIQSGWKEIDPVSAEPK